MPFRDTGRRPGGHRLGRRRLWLLRSSPDQVHGPPARRARPPSCITEQVRILATAPAVVHFELMTQESTPQTEETPENPGAGIVRARRYLSPSDLILEQKRSQRLMLLVVRLL